MSTDRLLSWLLTYSVHSTLFLGIAWLVAGRLSRRAPAAAEAVWRFALVAGLATATLSTFAPWRPAGGSWSLATAVDASHSVALPEAPAPAFGRLAPATPPAPTASTLSGVSSARIATPALAAPRVERTWKPESPEAWRRAALALWSLGAGLLLLGAARSYYRLRLRLRDRPRVVGGNLHAQLRQLAGDAEVEGVRLTCSSRVPVPLALGRREICVPPRALAALSPEQQEGMLAHELAHLVRRDPLWLVATHLVTCVAFFQPLNWLARRRLRELSELLADEWAVGRTGRPLSLAGCLAEVAGWAFGHRRLPAAAMADRPSNLARRITRLLDGQPGAGRVRRAALAAGLGLSLVAVLAAAPVVRSVEPGEREAGSEAKGAKAEWAAADAARQGGSASAERRAREAVKEDAERRVEAREREAEIREAEEDAAREGSEPHLDSLGDLNDAELDRAIDAAVEGAMKGAMAGVEASLKSLDTLSDGLDLDLGDLEELKDLDSDISREISRRSGELDRLRSEGKLTAEERRKLAREMAEMSRELVNRLQPQMQRLSEDVARQVQQSMAGSEEMQKLAREMAKRAAAMKPDPEAARRLEELARELAADGRLSKGEAAKLAEEARGLAESVKMSEPQLRELQELAKHQAELARELVAEHREEIEAARKEMRQDIEREKEGMRRQLEQQRNEQRERQREERQDRRDAERDRRHEKRDKPETSPVPPPGR